ncbi:MAG: beta-propeller domain-containing protein [Thermoplasmata archaeon]|nr:MAG: beta-propeller domain-containing protein [Thermoplasmata archaeon]
MVKYMLSKKMIILGILLISTLLFANMTLGNMNITSSVSEENMSDTGIPYDEDGQFADSDYIAVRSNDKIIYLRVPSDIRDLIMDDMEIHNEDQEDHGYFDFPFIWSEKPEGDNESPDDKNEEIDEGEENGDTSPYSLFANQESSEHVKRFASFEEFKSYMEKHTMQGRYYWNDPWVDGPVLFRGVGTVTLEGTTTSISLDTYDQDLSVSTSSQIEHSTTNVQVYGVDEGDIVKNDGKHAYILSKDRDSILIAEVYPPEDARIVSIIKTAGSIREIYIQEDRLVVLGTRQIYNIDPLPIYWDDTEVGIGESIILDIGGYYYFNYLSYLSTFIEIYDVEDKQAPELLKTHSWKGDLGQSRMIGEHLYLIIRQYINSNMQCWDLPVSAEDIYYFDSLGNPYSQYSHWLTTIMSIDILEPEKEPNSKVVLMRSSSEVYVSMGNIYLTYTEYVNYSQKTVIHRISIHDGEIMYEATGDVPGYILNRFSMDEYEGNFRIATGTWGGSNGVYVLDLDLDVVGNVTNIAPGEQIYSVRYMGARAYLVTFRRVDPFFVIDLSDPKAPKILGELKIPGFSNYLHPYDENHVIGLGKETPEDGRGILGVKLSLFDVTDVANPKEISKYVIGSRYSSSSAEYDPHAFLFCKEKNLLVVPVRLNYSWHGAYVFDISLENGFVLKDIIDHYDDSEDQTNYNYCYDRTIKRSFYIQDTLYTLSNVLLKMNDLEDLNEVGQLDLTIPDGDEPDLPIICIEVESIQR